MEIVDLLEYSERAQLREWFEQLRGKPDSVLGKKRICQFGNFVRAVLIHE